MAAYQSWHPHPLTRIDHLRGSYRQRRRRGPSDPIFLQHDHCRQRRSVDRTAHGAVSGDAVAGNLEIERAFGLQRAAPSRDGLPMAPTMQCSSAFVAPHPVCLNNVTGSQRDRKWRRQWAEARIAIIGATADDIEAHLAASPRWPD
jgi:hypothetical protein